MSAPDIEPFDAVDVIRTKRDGGAVDEAALRWMVDAYTRGFVADSQMAAFAMAILLNGMERDEIRVLTDAMIASGERPRSDRSPSRTSPAAGGTSPMIAWSVEDFPAPFGPIKPTISPGATVSDTSLTGFRRPCRIGPIAAAPPNRSVIL